MTADPVRDQLAARLEALGVPFELFPCDPALADTAAFCAAYGFDPDESANTILVVGKSDPPRYAACVVLATTRLDVNRVVRDRLGCPSPLQTGIGFALGSTRASASGAVRRVCEMNNRLG